jgi:hypothetical protein
MINRLVLLSDKVPWGALDFTSDWQRGQNLKSAPGAFMKKFGTNLAS